MRSDPNVEEMRRNGESFAAQYGNDLRLICRALREKEEVAGRKGVNRAPKSLTRRDAG
jgi:hypothetical protein